MTGFGLPELHGTRTDVFWTLLFVIVPQVTELCDGKKPSANRRKRDIDVFSNRMERETGKYIMYHLFTC